MSPRSQDRIDKSREEALAAFVSKKAEIDEILNRLQALSNDHFGYSPNEITWSHAEGLAHYARLLKRITDQPSTRTSTPGSRPDLPPTPRAAARRRGSGS